MDGFVSVNVLVPIVIGRTQPPNVTLKLDLLRRSTCPTPTSSSLRCLRGRPLPYVSLNRMKWIDLETAEKGSTSPRRPANSSEWNLPTELEAGPPSTLPVNSVCSE